MTNEELKAACAEVTSYLEEVQSITERDVSLNERGILVLGICAALLERLEREEKDAKPMVGAEREAAKQDTERLDWLLRDCWFSGIGNSPDLELTALDRTKNGDDESEYIGHYLDACREAIDAARKSEPSQQEPTNAD
jgi:hypothetical protein